MGTWQLQDAKAKLSKVIATAKKQGPQIITQRGVSTAVVIPFKEWEILSANEDSSKWRPGVPLSPEQHRENERLLKFFQSCPEFDLPERAHIRMKKPVKF